MATRTVTVTLTLTVTDPRKLRREVIRRTQCPASEFKGLTVAELAQYIVDDGETLRLSEAGLQIEQSESEGA